MTWKTIPMALLRVEINDKTLGIIRNHKAGSTTAMNYIGQALAGWTPSIEPNYKLWLDTFGRDSYIHKHGEYSDYAQELADCDIRVAIWRDPVSKFVSGFFHTMFSETGAQEGLWKTKNRTLDTFMDHYDHYCTNLNVLDHCSTNTRKLGSHRSHYTHVLPLFRLDKFKILLERMTGKMIHSVRHRKQSNNLTKLLKSTEDRVKSIMRQDYQNRWYSD